MAEALTTVTPPQPVRPEGWPQPQPTGTPAPAVKVVTVAPKAADKDAAAAAATPPAGLDNTKLTVSLDSETGTYIYKSVNADDGEIVWQWPSEQVMRVIQYFRRIESLEDKLAAKRAVDQKA
jgi:hypothetical protein